MRAQLLPGAQRELLTVLSDGRIYCYRELAAATGQHSGLSHQLRERTYSNSLGSKGFVREDRLTYAEMGISKSSDFVYTFQITTTGCAAIGVKASALFSDPDAAVADFAARYRSWWASYQEDQSLAQRLGLRHNPFVLLRALADTREPMTYKQLTQATGIFSGLVQDLRHRHARHRSLAWLGLIEETVVDDEARGKYIHAFQITAKGLALLAGSQTIPPKQRKPLKRRLAPPIPCGDVE